MAYAEKTESGVQLNLSNMEARYLQQVLYNIGGHPEFSGRFFTDKILISLLDVGVHYTEKELFDQKFNNLVFKDYEELNG